MSTVFVINSGSSSIKYQLINPALEGKDAVVASGMVDQIGLQQGKYSIKHDGEKIEHQAEIPDHAVGLQLVIDLFNEVGLNLDEQDVVAVGHRVVQGGNLFREPVKIDDTVIEQIASLSPLAPLHNPAHVLGMKVARDLLPDIPHVAVFDTAFFADLPDASRIYPIPQDIAEKYAVRRYGAHGTSHQYVSQQVPRLLDRDPATLRQIIFHLGNGASASAIRGGKPIDTSMGLTPLEGLVMGTRCGDIDASVVFHLMRQGGYTVDEMDTMFNRESGVKAMIGSSDMRDLDDLMAAHDPVGQRCWDVYVHRVKRYLGAYMAELGGLDVIVFTAGIGEKSPEIRFSCLEGLEELGIEVDEKANNHRMSTPTIISTPTSKVTVMVVPTNEELAISRHALQFAK